MGKINVGQVQVLTFEASKSFIDGVLWGAVHGAGENLHCVADRAAPVAVLGAEKSHLTVSSVAPLVSSEVNSRIVLI